MSQAEKQETIIVDANADGISCDGGGELGHPKVFYNFDDKSLIECSYCYRIFIKSS